MSRIYHDTGVTATAEGKPGFIPRMMAFYIFYFVSIYFVEIPSFSLRTQYRIVK
jgi:hypothetical protein